MIAIWISRPFGGNNANRLAPRAAWR